MTKRFRVHRFNTLRQTAAMLAVLVVAGVGVYFLATSRAAAPQVKVEAEAGILADGATTINKGDASGGEAVYFNGGIGPAGTYTYYSMAGSSLTNMNDDVTINNVANLGTADYFWSHSFYFNSPPSTANSEGAAYIGIQGINLALFSIFGWPSTEASPSCTVQQSGFDGGAYPYGGTSCKINYTLTKGHTYRLSVTDNGQDSQGINWLGTVQDLTTGVTTTIATVNVPASWGTFQSDQIVWTEYFGPAITSCSQLPLSNVTFSNFTANNGAYTAPASHSDVITQNACTSYSSITDNSANSFTHIMGMAP